MGDVLLRKRADQAAIGEYLYLEDIRATVAIRAIHRSGDLLAICWRGGVEYRNADEFVCVEVMT